MPDLLTLSSPLWYIAAAVFAGVMYIGLRIAARSRTADGKEDAYQTITLPDAPGQIALQDWMTDPRTIAVFDAIEAAGGEVRFVGGCVRDAVLKLPIGDIDLATTLAPEATMAACQRAGMKVVPTGIQHGTVTCISGGQPFEVTTLRTDEETDGRHARVAFTDDWKADAARRDFTMNALSMTREGMIYDYFNGLRDLAERNVIFIGDPNERIAEDYLRILRFFRFTGRYGRIPPAIAALAACRRAADHIDDLSGERIRQEMLKLLSQRSPALVLELMADEHILERVMPVRPHIGMLNGMVWLETRAMGTDRLMADPIRRLAAMLHGERDAAAELAERWRLSNAERKRLLDLAIPDDDIATDMSDEASREKLFHFDSGGFADRVLLAWAREIDHSKHPDNASWRRLYEFAAGEAEPVFPIGGKHLVAAGVPAGPEVGRLLARLERFWLDRNCEPDQAALMAELERMRNSAG